MPAYLVLTYDVSDADAYRGYNPERLGLIMQTVQAHGGKILSAGQNARWLGGEPRSHIVMMEFPSVEAAQAWEDDPAYAEARAIRLGSTSSRIEFIADAFTPPS